jgi:signal transduction histidine kinase
MNALIFYLLYVINNTRIRFIRKLVELLKSAKENEKAKEMFIASMSNELRNPLDSMLCSIEVLVSEFSENLTKKQRDLISTMSD